MKCYDWQLSTARSISMFCFMVGTAEAQEHIFFVSASENSIIMFADNSVMRQTITQRVTYNKWGSCYITMVECLRNPTFVVNFCEQQKRNYMSLRSDGTLVAKGSRTLKHLKVIYITDKNILARKAKALMPRKVYESPSRSLKETLLCCCALKKSWMWHIH